MLEAPVYTAPRAGGAPRSRRPIPVNDLEAALAAAVPLLLAAAGTVAAGARAGRVLAAR
ncbi:hypothetical protein [Dactylosporangium sp. NPDC000521]|uniref:hypothetical protein n=1 Tax=Dactylosporangium sp. NPDC000521 TaxID=3363975 RepID=UPI0036B0D1A2